MLLSYGPSISWMYGEAGEYIGQILKGSNPTEMPVLQPRVYHAARRRAGLARYGARNRQGKPRRLVGNGCRLPRCYAAARVRRHAQWRTWVAMVTCPAYFGNRLFQENESPQMPLTRLNDSAFPAQLEGVYFGMWNGSTPVRCFVSHEALTDKAQGSGQAESLDVFHEYRSEIENLASAKYDAGKIRSDGLVVVDSPDLNPGQFQQGLA